MRSNFYRKRELKIKALRRSGLKWREIGTVFGITSTRAQQIFNHKVLFCKKHRKRYVNRCTPCVLQGRSRKILEEFTRIIAQNGFLKDEMDRLRPQNRISELVQRRKALVKILHDSYKLPFKRIGQLMHRDHSTIMHLYNSIKKQEQTYARS